MLSDTLLDAIREKIKVIKGKKEMYLNFQDSHFQTSILQHGDNVWRRIYLRCSFK